MNHDKAADANCSNNKGDDVGCKHVGTGRKTKKKGVRRCELKRRELEEKNRIRGSKGKRTIQMYGKNMKRWMHLNIATKLIPKYDTHTTIVWEKR